MLNRFTVTTICGSMRYFDRMITAAQSLSRDGWIVLMPFVRIPQSEQITSELKQTLDVMHRAKIDLSYSIHVVGEHRGESTLSEIAYASQTGKSVFYYKEHEAREPTPIYDALGSSGNGVVEMDVRSAYPTELRLVHPIPETPRWDSADFTQDVPVTRYPSAVPLAAPDTESAPRATVRFHGIGECWCGTLHDTADVMTLNSAYGRYPNTNELPKAVCYPVGNRVQSIYQVTQRKGTSYMPWVKSAVDDITGTLVTGESAHEKKFTWGDVTVTFVVSDETDAALTALANGDGPALLLGLLYPADSITEAARTLAGRSRGTGTRTRSASRDGKPDANGATPDEIRAWAKSNGLTVNERGRVPAEIRAKFDAAHGPGSKPATAAPANPATTASATAPADAPASGAAKSDTVAKTPATTAVK